MVPSLAPTVVVLGGPNGAGKTTAAPRLLRGTLRVEEFINADTLAQGLSAFRPDAAAIEAGRIMLRRFDNLAAKRVSFAFESTLASQGLARRLAQLQTRGYSTHVLYLWLPSVELALARVRERVRNGGHDVPADTIRRRFERGRRNFFELYRPIVKRWRLYDASALTGPRLVASGGINLTTRVLDSRTWHQAAEGCANE
jgi:predicted ABC-type ATPase